MGAEVDIDISLEDISGTLAECFAEVTDDRLGEPPPNVNDVIRTFRHIGEFLRAITDEQISMLNPAQRRVIGTFLATQAARFKAVEVMGPDETLLSADVPHAQVLGPERVSPE